MKIVLAMLAVTVFALASRAQAPSAADVDNALAKADAFFEDRTNQTLAGCSDEAWAITRQESLSALNGKNGPKISDDDVLRKQKLLDACSASIEGHMTDLWGAVASMLNMEKDADNGKFTDDIKSQLRYYEVLRLADTEVSSAISKLLTDRLFDALAESRANYKGLVDRFNLVVTAPIYRTVPPNSAPYHLRVRQGR